MTIRSQIKRIIALHPFYSLLIIIVVVLAIAGCLVPLWYTKVRRIEDQVKLIEGKVDQELDFRLIHRTSMLFSSINSTATNLVRMLNSSLGDNSLQFYIIKSKIASALFQGLSTIPYLKQISYIGLDGLFFAYYTQGDQPYALYSNSTFQNSSNSYTWYVQTADRNAGKLYGDATKFPPSAVVNSSWVQNALNSTNVFVSVASGWGNDSDILLLSTAGMLRKSAVSLGFSLEPIVEFLVSELAIYNGSFYLATKDGKVLTQGIPGMRIVLTDDHVSLQLVSSDGDKVYAAGDITCGSNNGGSVLSIWDRKFEMHCSQVEIAGLQLVYVLAVPSNEFSSNIDKNIRWAFALLLIMIGVVVAMICAFVYLVVECLRREMHLCRDLINQKEATQQAERKSMNKSLAFASASHDIRASLAGIRGLIDLCYNEVSRRRLSLQELLTNLSQMDSCTLDLVGILNSILDTSKIEAGKMQLDEEEFDMEELLENVVDLYHPLGIKKGVDIILDPCNGSVSKCSRVRGDRGKLKQILSNLVSNAVKFTSEGDVTVGAWTRKQSLENEIIASNVNSSMKCLLCFKAESESESGNNNVKRDSNCVEFVFEVSDTGEGIPKEKQKAVFENYVQVKESVAGQEGTGLGLGIVQSLVRLMGGEIRLVNKDVGERGTCFRFNVFLSAAAAVAETRAHDIESNGDGVLSDSYKSRVSERSQVILFIHNPKRRKVVQGFMQRLGIKVRVIGEDERLPSALKQINQKLNLSYYYNNSSSTNSRSDGAASRTSSMRSRDVTLSARDEIMDNVLASKKKGSAHVRSFTFILLVIDIRAGPFKETWKAVAEFRRGLNERCSSRAIWLYDPTMSSSSSHAMDMDRLPRSDLIISKPFHGSRLRQAVRLLPELGGAIAREEERLPLSKRVSFGGTRTSSSSASSKSGVRGKIPKHSFGVAKKSEIEEVGGSSSKNPMEGKRVLVVDDDLVGRRIASAVCKQLGADAVTCENGAEACQEFYRRLQQDDIENAGRPLSPPFDCIFMDCQMPVMNGVEATAEIRKAELNKFHTPIIALTAHQQGEELEAMMEAGADAYLTKPLKKTHLSRVMFDLYTTN
ncbi:histidine kinase CKI1 [Andrographis paniculata]|uniref:histidine kinase CKI1 n=1 Tax=Andrographis paniculata TaxID=175694 RepID=UPI0021E7D01A|nr:histidine kinase CKI1 [Andrographis paniculata]